MKDTGQNFVKSPDDNTQGFLNVLDDTPEAMKEIKDETTQINEFKVDDNAPLLNR